MNSLKDIIDSLGATKVAEICGISVRAVYKWRRSNSLPRTDYTGETQYSERLSKALKHSISAKDIRLFSNPTRSSSASSA